jgi:hypothetical protein
MIISLSLKRSTLSQTAKFFADFFGENDLKIIPEPKSA